MAGFGFTEEQEMFRRELRRFLQRELGPDARERARLDYIPHDVYKKVADYGLIRLNVPEELGGEPADWVSVGIMSEELGRVDFCLYHPISMAKASTMAFQYAPEDTRREWLPSILSGDKIICLALTEPECGSDAAALRTRAVRDGDSYILNGEKTSISQGIHADVAMLFAKTDPDARARGVSCFLVPMDAPGVTRSGFKTMGWSGVPGTSIILEDVRVPARYRLGEEGQGFYLVMRQFDFIRVCLALLCLGAAQVSLEETINYAKERMAFGQPIAKFEGVSFKIAEHAARMEAVRWLCYHTMSLRDQGKTHTKESAMCKMLGPVVAREAIHSCLLTHGHVGYSEEYPIERRLRNVIGLEIGDGTADIMKVVISREILGREFLPY